jgi:hypothetical protein
MSDLRPYQQEAIDWFFALPKRRAILSHSMGAGKTRTALEIAKRLGAKRILIVCSAMARGTWVRETAKWAPELQLHSIRFGVANGSLTKAQKAEREAAYAADVQVVSYALLKHVDGSPRDLVIADESHRIKSPTSAQGRQFKAYLDAYPDVPALLLTATLVTKEVEDLWHQVECLYPGYFGEAPDTGEVPWSFRRSYMESEEGWEGRKKWFGAKQDALPRLGNKLKPLMHRVTSEEVSKFTPPLHMTMMWVDDPRQKDAAIAKEWLTDKADEGVTHTGAFAWLHETAGLLAAAARAAGWPVVFVTGSHGPEQRQQLLDEAKAMPRCCVVGTAGSLAESISLSFVREAIVTEWRSSPGQALQFLGRFGRMDSATLAPTYLQFIARTDDSIDAEKLIERLTAVNTLMKADAKSEQLQEMLKPRVLDEALLENIMAASFRTVRLGLANAMIDEGDSDD